MTSSELPGLYQLSLAERRRRLAAITGLEPTALVELSESGGLGDRAADRMVENALGVFGLPLGVATNLRLDGVDRLVPMAIEEPSVIAAASHAAKLLRAGGGLTSRVTPPHMVGQVQILEVQDVAGARARIAEAAPALLALANAGHRRLVEAGGGAFALETAELAPLGAEDPVGPMLVVHVLVDVRDAMGANAINGMCEALAPRLAELSGGRVGLKILSNLSDRRRVEVEGAVPVAALAGHGLDGMTLARRIEEASVFAERDPYRASTHNKGIMNGIDAVLVAFGQDYRAVEAGAHAYAARGGRYTALATWRVEGDRLVGRLDVPMAVGVVGGISRVHPMVALARAIARVNTAAELAATVAAIGLCQNLGALRALAGEGIQHGHMRLHARNLAVEAGAEGAEVHAVAERIAAAEDVHVDRARVELAALRRTAAEATATPVIERFDALRQTHLPAILELIDEVLGATTPAGSTLVPMCGYHLETGGKRIRALLPLLVAEALGEPAERAVPFGAACEMLHNATLVHDDLQDGDELRRGRPTVWKKYGPAQAINLGDAMFYYTLLLAQRSDAGPQTQSRVATRVLEDTLKVIDGQEREFLLKLAPAPTLEAYFAMVEGKTSGLFALPLAGAARLLQAPAAVEAALETAATHLGVLFQIQDDVLDLYADKGREAAGRDIAEGKRSALVVHALGAATPAERAWLVAVLDKPRPETTEAEIAEAIALLERTGSLDFVLAEIDRRAELARTAPGLADHPRLAHLIAGLTELLVEPIARLRAGRPRRATAPARAGDAEAAGRSESSVGAESPSRRDPPDAPGPGPEDLLAVLPKVSRTFALSIAALPEPLRAEVATAYLLCRLVDTIEDDPKLAGDARRRLFDAFERALAGEPGAAAALAALGAETALGATEAERELSQLTEILFAQLERLEPGAVRVVRRWVAEMSTGMREYSSRADRAGRLEIRDLEDLERYCYFVAGTVGELLTGLFTRGPAPTAVPPDELRRLGVRFGLGLQLVNIVKDVAEDLTRGDCFLPVDLLADAGLDRADLLDPRRRSDALGVLQKVTARARGHLEAAREYTLAFAGPELRAVRQFSAVPLALAFATLAEVERSPDALTPGRTPKLTREEVAQTFGALTAALDDPPRLAALLGATRSRRPPVPASSPFATPSETEREEHEMETLTLQPARTFAGKILVTGASGHLGANLVHRLVSEGRDVRVFLHEGSDNRAMDGLPVERVYGDLRDADKVTAGLRGIETAYHCAAKVSTIHGNAAHKREIFECNVLATRNLLRAAKDLGTRRLVVTGSFSAVGRDLDDPHRPATEDMPVYPFETRLPYARTKEQVEHECLKAAAEGLDVVVATSCAIVGPHDYKPSRVGQTLIDFAHGRLRAYIPGAFEWVAARDIVEGHVLAMHRGRSGHKYVFSTEFLDLDQILTFFEEVSGRRRPRLRLPPDLLLPIAEVTSLVLSNLRPNHPQRFTPGAIRILKQRRRADLTKARQELGYAPTSVRQAVHEAYAHFMARGLVPASPSVEAGAPTAARASRPSDAPAAARAS